MFAAIAMVGTLVLAPRPAYAQDADEDEGLRITVPPGSPAARYQSEIKNLEAEFGAFHPELGEQLFGLAQAYERTRRYDQAASAYERAFQIERVNGGLHSAAQRDIVERLIAVHSARGDFDRVDDFTHYKAWLVRRNDALPTEERIAALLEVGDWNLRAYELPTETLPFRHLRAAEDSYERAAALALENASPRPELVFGALDGVANVNYRMAYLARTGGSVAGSGVSAASFNNSREVDEIEVRQRIIARSYRDGRRALETASELAASMSPIQVAARMTLLGDWYQLFSRRHGARKQYQAAYEALVGAGFDEEEIDLMFQAPVPLPVAAWDTARRDASSAALDAANPTDPEARARAVQTAMVALGQTAPDVPAEADRGSAPRRASPYVRTTFSVTASGRVLRARVVESQPESDVSMRRDALRMVRLTAFRPKLVAGEPVTAEDVELKFVFPGEEPSVAGQDIETEQEES